MTWNNQTYNFSLNLFFRTVVRPDISLLRIFKAVRFYPWNMCSGMLQRSKSHPLTGKPSLKKSDLSPSQDQLTSGCRSNTQIEEVYLSDRRVDKLADLVLSREKESPFSTSLAVVETFSPSSVIGELLPVGRGHRWSLQLQLLLRDSWSQDQDAKTSVVPSVTEVFLDLIWWIFLWPNHSERLSCIRTLPPKIGRTFSSSTSFRSMVSAEEDLPHQSSRMISR